jgi:hypothetical protein
MFDIDDEQKKEIIIETCKKIDYINFKFEAIQSEFKNIKKKFSHYNYIKKINNIESWSMYDIVELERTYKNINNKLKNLSNKENINLFEDQDINYFIKYYNITFEEDTKPFCIEI